GCEVGAVRAAVDTVGAVLRGDWAHWVTDLAIGPDARQDLLDGNVPEALGTISARTAIAGTSTYMGAKYAHSLKGLLPGRLPQPRGIPERLPGPPEPLPTPTTPQRTAPTWRAR